MTAAAERNAAIDMFRGLTIFLMIVVNTMGPGASPYPVLVHADWLGFTLADLVFPSFLFIMGASLAFVLKKPVRDCVFLARTARRTGLLFLLGFLMYWFPFVHLTPDLSFAFNPLGETRLMGVLQRLALCYGLAALAARYLSPARLIWLCVAALAGYWSLLVWGAPPGEAFDKTHNFATVIDRLVLGQAHMWRYDGGFEPEGLLGTIPATVNVLAGFLAVTFLRQNAVRLITIVVAGVALSVLALVLDPVLPLSKKLWTPSFVFLTVGLDLVGLALLAVVLNRWKLAALTGFFEVLGKNPLTVYLFSELVIPLQALFKAWLMVEPYQWVGVEIFQRAAPGPLGALVCAIAYALVCWLFGYALYRRQIFIRL